VSAHQSAANVSANLGDGVVGKVKYSITSGRLTFNGKPLGNTEHSKTLDNCRALLGEG
jgi:hypothetical protein